MTKNEKTKLKKKFKEYLVEKKIYSEVHDTLINQLVDWIEIDEYAKGELMNDPSSWTTISTISVASKNIQNIMTKLGLTPQTQKVKLEVEKPVDLESVIKEITSK